MNSTSIKAKDFALRWKGRGSERSESQSFWIDLLGTLGVERPTDYIKFEEGVHIDRASFIDGYLEETKVLIEQKSIGKSLSTAIRQSDGSLLTPFQQARRYIVDLPVSRHPNWVVTSNFEEFWVYDMNRPGGEPEKIRLDNLEQDYHRLEFLVKKKNPHAKREMELSIQAGELVGRIYEGLLKQYKDPESAKTLRSLNILCVRLVFLLYAEDAEGVFDDDNMFRTYLKKFDYKHARKAIVELFKVLNTPIEDRDYYLEDELKVFPYVNGGLFAEEIEIPAFSEEVYNLLVDEASEGFDWSGISPTIFGAVFESTLNAETRRSGGMHYTSIENIHKVIDPLFLDDLREELDQIKVMGDKKARNKKLIAYQDKLANLRWFDPACGSGNFLTETFLCIRRLENEAIELMTSGQISFGDVKNPVKVSIDQFYGIEINDFAVSVAKTALWIAESQMLNETRKVTYFMDMDFLPLKTNANIVEGNALRIDWGSVVPKDKLNYIMGNPPFVGARWMSKEQKADVLEIFGPKWKGVGDLDYVCCWYKKSSEIMSNTRVRCALVSTNSISQGGAVANLWKPLFESGVHIDFAHRTFVWDSEASVKAHVHCVIIGFSIFPYNKSCLIYSGTQKVIAHNINGYLIDGENIFVEKRMKPISEVPSIALGGQAIDGGHLILTHEEKDELLKQEPQADVFLRPYMMGKDFIDRKPRYCIWLVKANPTLLKKCPLILGRIEKVREFRRASDRASTLKAAETPSLFASILECQNAYIAIPKVSTENRRYIPMDYLSAQVIPGDKLFVMQDASMYHFGILTSNVHMAWMRTVCGRMKSDYSYSNTIVYNNFPWPNPTEEQKNRISATAQAILDARALYPDSSLADLYDELTMPPELRKAHQNNDRAVMAAYGFPVKDFTESDCVAELMKLYQQKVEEIEG